MKQNPKPYEWDWDGACAPGKCQYSHDTFSVGIFQWLPKASGKGLKRGKVMGRVKGRSDKPEKVYAEADRIVARENAREKAKK